MTSVYSLGTSNNDVQNHLDVQRPSTLLEKFFFQIMEEVKSGNEELAGYLFSRNSSGNDPKFNDLGLFIHQYNNEKLEPYLEESFLSWVRNKLAGSVWSHGLKNLRTMVEIVQNEEWYKKKSRLLEFIDTHIKLSDEGIVNLEASFLYQLPQVVFEDENMTEMFCQEINQTFRDILYNYKLNELELMIGREYEHAMSKLPYCQHDVNDKRLKSFFTLTVEQRKELWNTIIHLPLSNGELEPLSEYLSENPYYYSAITNQFDKSEYVLSVMSTIIMDKDIGSMKRIVESCTDLWSPSLIANTGASVFNLN